MADIVVHFAVGILFVVSVLIGWRAGRQFAAKTYERMRDSD